LLMIIKRHTRVREAAQPEDTNRNIDLMNITALLH
jgi:hypothetical protein